MTVHSYMKLDGIDGECTAKGQEKNVEILSWSHGFAQPTSSVRASSGSTVERAFHSDVDVTKYLDTASDGIIKTLWTGKQLGFVTISCYRADGNEQNAPTLYLEVKLEKVIISHYSISGGNGGLPTEHISFNYGKVTYTYKPQKESDGTAGAQLVSSADLVQSTIS